MPTPGRCHPSDPQPPMGSHAAPYPTVPGSAYSKSRADVCTRRGSVAFWLQKGHAHVFGAAAGPSIPPHASKAHVPPMHW